MKRVLSVLLFLALGTAVLWGQAREVSGTVVNADDGEPVPGVSVAVKGTSIGTITGVDGRFEIEVPQDGEVLVFSFIGMLTQEVEIGNNTVVDVVMEQDLLDPALVGLEAAESEALLWQGAPWHVMDLIWVKSKVWVVESRSTNPNYGYGPCEGWIEQGTSFHAFKRITDPSGKLWKGAYHPAQALETPDGKFRMTINGGYVEVDMRRNHGTLLEGTTKSKIRMFVLNTHGPAGRHGA